MIKKLLLSAGLVMAITAAPAHALIISVAGPNSSLGTAPAIIPAPQHALDDIVFNTGMEGFDEAQGVVTTVAHATDTGTIAAGSLVNSHMIFLNSQGVTTLTHRNVDWTFDGIILGVMSDRGGNLEAASTFELGNPLTNYTVTFPGSGPAAPFGARGMEGDSYSQLLPNVLRVNMGVSEPGDWIRVVTAVNVPEPSVVALLGLGLLLLGLRAVRK